MEYYLLFLVMSFLLMGAMMAYHKFVGYTASHTSYHSNGNDINPYMAAFLVSLAAFTLSSVIVSVGMFAETSDTEIWNGKVVSKTKDRVSCSHSYDCNCKNVESCSGSGKDRICSTSRVCDTCYEHTHDYDWTVHTTIGNYDIDRIDRQGVREPQRWTGVFMGEPVSKTKTFTNYIKGARNNVINRSGVKVTYPMPNYPTAIYDYYRIDRAVSADSAVPNLPAWSASISDLLKDLGTSKEVNVVMVFTKQQQDFADQLNSAWLGGKKNDVIIVIGVTSDLTKAEWVKVLSWTKREDFKVELRDSIMDANLTPSEVVPIITTVIKSKFDRRSMEEFDYLKYDIEPPYWSFISALIAFFLPLIGYVISLRRT